MTPEVKRAHLDSLYLQIFEDDKRGQAIFEDLYQRFVSASKVHTEGGIDAVLKTYHDAARREVIEYIVTCCNRARALPSEETTIEAPSL